MFHRPLRGSGMSFYHVRRLNVLFFVLGAEHYSFPVSGAEMFCCPVPGAEISFHQVTETEMSFFPVPGAKMSYYLYNALLSSIWSWNFLGREQLKLECPTVQYLELKGPPLGTRWPDSWGSSWFAVAASQSRTAKKVRPIFFFESSVLRIFFLGTLYWSKSCQRHSDFLYEQSYLETWVICFVRCEYTVVYMA